MGIKAQIPYISCVCVCVFCVCWGGGDREREERMFFYTFISDELMEVHCEDLTQKL